MTSKPRGHVYIIDNEDFENDVFRKRKGSHVDSENLNDLFSQLGFKVDTQIEITFHNPTLAIF